MTDPDPDLQLAIWDVDGTLVDSREVIQSAMVRAFDACALTPPSYDQTRQIVGLDLFEACRRLAPPDYAEMPKLVAAYRQAFVSLRAEPDFEERLYEGALETLTEMTQSGWLLAIATGKSRNGLRALFESHPLENYFDTIWCADDGPGKPDPFMCQQAMSALGVVPENTFMIGDAIHDIRMGNSAGVRSLGVSWGFGAADELRDAGAHSVYESFDDLQRFLKLSKN